MKCNDDGGEKLSETEGDKITVMLATEGIEPPGPNDAEYGCRVRMQALCR